MLSLEHACALVQITLGWIQLPEEDVFPSPHLEFGSAATGNHDAAKLPEAPELGFVASQGLKRGLRLEVGGWRLEPAKRQGLAKRNREHRAQPGVGQDERNGRLLLQEVAKRRPEQSPEGRRHEGFRKPIETPLGTPVSVRQRTMTSGAGSHLR